MRKILLILLFLTIAMPAAQSSPAAAGDDEDNVYIFAFFRHGEKTYIQEKQFFSGGAGVYLAWSEDGLNWKEIGDGRHFFKPERGDTLRDPTIIRGPEGRFHLVWTTGWRSPAIGYASSPDLLHWENERLLPVMKHEPGALNTWAPEIFYDDAAGQFIIHWSTTIQGRFTDTWEPDEGYNHRVYYTTTKDFKGFSKPALFHDPGFNCIDPTLLKDGDKYLMFIKNETLHPPAKYIFMAQAEKAEGPYEQVSGRISPGGVWAEGPSAIKIGDTYYVYYDMFRENRFGVVASRDRAAWEDLTDKLTMPRGAKHGSVFKVSRAELNKLLEAAGAEK